MSNTESNNAKKKYLNSYKWLKHRARSLELEIEAIRSQYTGHAITYSDMPKAPSSAHDLSDYASAVFELVDSLNAIHVDIIRQYEQISEAIEVMENETEKELLRLRYLQSYDWDDIAEHFGYVVRTVYRIHGSALYHFQIPKDVSKCQ